MKKLSLMIILFISISFIFVACGKTDEKQCKEVVKNFSVEMYTQSCDELENLYGLLDTKDAKEFEENNKKFISSFDIYKKYFTEKGFKKAFSNRFLTLYHNYLMENKKNIVFSDIKFNDISKNVSELDGKEFMHVKYTVYFDLTNKDGTIYKELKDDIYVTLNPIDDEWEIYYLRVTPFKSLNDR